MSYRWRALERQAQARTRRAVRASPALKRLRRQARRFWTSSHQLPGWISRLFFLGLAGTVVVARRPGPEFLLAVFGLWAVGMVLYHAIDLHNTLHAAPALYVLGFLPVADDHIFRGQWHVFLRKSVWTGFDYGVMGILVVVTDGRFGWGVLALTVAAAGLTWLFITAAGAVCCAFAPVRYLGWPSQLFLLAALGLLFFGQGLVEIVRLLAQAGAWIPGLLPLLKVLAPQMPVAAAPFAVGTVVGVVLVGLWPLAWRRLRANYRLGEDTLAYVGLVEAARSGHANAPAEWAEVFRREAREASEAIRSGAFLAGMDWAAGGLLERTFSRLLTVRERVVAEFITAGQPGWTEGFRRALVTLGVVLAILWLVPKALAGLSIFLFFGGAFFLQNLLGGWRGMGSAPGAGIQSPCFATQPIGLREILRVSVKINFLRLLCMTPALAGGWFLVVSHWILPAAVSLLAAKALVTAYFLVPLLPVFSLSQGTNDTRRTGFACGALLIGLLAVAAGITFFVTESLTGIIAAGLATGALCLGFVRFYAWYYNHGRLDLVPLAKADAR